MGWMPWNRGGACYQTGNRKKNLGKHVFCMKNPEEKTNKSYLTKQKVGRRRGRFQIIPPGCFAQTMAWSSHLISQRLRHVYPSQDRRTPRLLVHGSWLSTGRKTRVGGGGGGARAGRRWEV